MNMDFELKIDAKTMGKFLLRYNYTKATGLFGILLGLASLVALTVKWDLWNANQRVVWLVIAFLFLVAQPLTLVRKGKRQLEQDKMQEPLFCHVDEEGLTVKQGEASSACKWENVRKIVYGRDVVYIFTSAIYATIITAESCEGRFDELVAFLKEKKKK